MHELAPFPVSTIPSLGTPDVAHMREDIAGGMTTIGYRNGPLLTQWRTTDVAVRIALAPVDGKAEDVAIGRVPGLWLEGTARGTFTLVGADGTVHRERFEVGSGALLWRRGAMTFLLQRVADKDDAVELAAATAA